MENSYEIPNLENQKNDVGKPELDQICRTHGD